MVRNSSVERWRTLHYPWLELTTFRRGRSGEDAAGVTVVLGDRMSVTDVARLVEAGRWNVVVDIWGYMPREVLAMAGALESVVGRCVFVSRVFTGTTYHCDEGGGGVPRFGYAKSDRRVTAYYFYLVDEVFGPAFMKGHRPPTGEADHLRAASAYPTPGWLPHHAAAHRR